MRIIETAIVVTFLLAVVGYLGKIIQANPQPKRKKPSDRVIADANELDLPGFPDHAALRDCGSFETVDEQRVVRTHTVRSGSTEVKTHEVRRKTMRFRSKRTRTALKVFVVLMSSKVLVMLVTVYLSHQHLLN